MLRHVDYGSRTEKTPVLIVHGLFGSARNWGAIARRLSDDRLVVAPDMRNHGESPWYPSHSYPDLAADLAEVIRAVGPPVDLVGHSMGGKAAMMLALTEPALIRRLVVADIAPAVYGHSQNHLIDAMQSLDPATLGSRGEAEAMLTPAVPDAGTRAFLLQSLDLKADPPRWRLNLPVLRAEMGTITGWPEAEGQFDGPVLFLTGALSDYVKPGHREAIKRLFPRARFARIPDAGHWLHADKPRAFEESLRAFLG